jgi:hypothetical protein
MNLYRIIWFNTGDALAEVLAGSPEASCDEFANSDPRLRQTIAASGLTASAWLADKVKIETVAKGGDA